MALIAPTITNNLTSDRVHIITWVTTAADTFTSVEIPGSADRSVQMSGTWNSSTIVLEGSNDGTTWFTLNDPFSNAISFTADGLKQITEITRYIRPRISAGTPTSVTITALLRRMAF